MEDLADGPVIVMARSTGRWRWIDMLIERGALTEKARDAYMEKPGEKLRASAFDILALGSSASHISSSAARSVRASFRRRKCRDFFGSRA